MLVLANDNCVVHHRMRWRDGFSLFPLMRPKLFVAHGFLWTMANIIIAWLNHWFLHFFGFKSSSQPRLLLLMSQFPKEYSKLVRVNIFRWIYPCVCSRRRDWYISWINFQGVLRKGLFVLSFDCKYDYTKPEDAEYRYITSFVGY